MAYVGATEITLILPAGITISGSSLPLTLDEVATMIAEIGAELDGAAAARGYLVPIPTGATTGYAQMQMAVKNGVGWRVLGALFPDMGGPGDKTSLAADYRDAYRAFVKSLKSGDTILVGAPAQSAAGQVLPRSRSTSQSVPDSTASGPVNLDWQP